MNLETFVQALISDEMKIYPEQIGMEDSCKFKKSKLFASI